MSIQEMSSVLNHFIIIKFYVIKIEIILIKKANYSKYCLNIEASNIYKINIYVSAYLNGINIAEILNIHQKLFILKENNIIVYNVMDSIIYDA